MVTITIKTSKVTKVIKCDGSKPIKLRIRKQQLPAPIGK